MRATLHDFQDIWALVERCKPELVSFDLFDTLVYRKVAAPTDVFRLQALRLRADGLMRLAAEEWLMRRKAAERRIARSIAPGEVRLAAIYEALLAEGLFANAEHCQQAMALELAIEHEVIRLFPDAVALLARVRQAGCGIVILSDTYLPDAFVRSCIAPLLPFVDALHCSSETQVTKRHGHAFSLLAAEGHVLHFGDNPRSDCKQARRNGVDGRLILSARQSWIRRNQPLIALLRLRGQPVPPLPEEGQPPALDSLEDLALRWAVILHDFLLDLRDRARAMGATDIWFGSRDCESLWSVVQAHPDFFGLAKASYVRVSRQATHPLMAAADPDRAARWSHDRHAPLKACGSELARRYYGALVRPETRRILFVDMISKGRLEQSLRLALPPGVALSGCYFALHPGHEASPEARVYLPFDHALLHAAAIEMLAGYRDGTCRGFALDEQGGVQPVL